MIVVLHRYLTLSVGLVIVVLSVSGSMLVFKEEMSAPHAEAAARSSGAPARTLQSLIEEALETRPGAWVQRIELPEPDGAPLQIAIRASDGSVQSVYADRSGLLPAPAWDGAFGWLRELHDSLFLQPALGARNARWAVGAAGLLTIAVSLSGLYLWWPRDAEARGSAFRVNWRASWKRTNWDLHRVGGVLSAAFILVVSASGTFVAFHTDMEPASLQPSRSAAGSLLAADELVERASALAPGALLRELRWSDPRGAAVLAILDGRAEQGAAELRLLLDARTGELAEPSAQSDALLMLDAMRSIHRGYIFGTAGRAMVFLTGFAPVFLALSGLLIWWCKHKSRRVAAERPPRVPAGASRIRAPAMQSRDELSGEVGRNV